MGDYVRWAPPYYGDDSQQPLGTRSALYLSLNRGKRSVRIDLKSDGGREAFLRLVGDADVVLESFRPGVLDRLGVGYERLREANPRIVYCAITGYGADGPNTARAGHDTNYLALERAARPHRRAPTARRSSRPARSPTSAAAALMAAFGDPRRAARARALGRGPVRRRLDDRRLALVAGDGRRRRTCATAGCRSGAPRCSTAASPATCPTSAPTAGSAAARSSRSSGRRFCEGVERPDLIEHQFARAGSKRRPHGGRRGLRGPHEGRVGALQRRARLLHRAGARPRRGARLRARARARDGGRGRAARARRRCACSAIR